MNVKKSDMVGSWNIDWQILYTEMNRPTLSGKTILIDLRKKQKGFLRLSTLGGRVVELTEQASATVSLIFVSVKSFTKYIWYFYS